MFCPLLARAAGNGNTEADTARHGAAPPADGTGPAEPAGLCMLFARRPLRCRLSDILSPASPRPGSGCSDDATGERERLWVDMLEQPLEDLSRRTFAALAGCEPSEDPPCFPLPEVLSGRYVQTVFHAIACLLRPGGNNGVSGTGGTGNAGRTGDAS